jgi:LemA protein
MDGVSPIWIVLGVVALFLIIFIVIYNRLVTLRNNRENAFADIDVQLKQRHDLIPQLLGAVKGYMNHESETLIKVTQARQAAMSAGTIDEKIAAEATLTTAMRGFSLQVEAYPELKANSNFLKLQDEISDIENKLASVRRFFNSATRELNNGVQKFPNNIIAGMFGFKTAAFFDVGDDERKVMDKAPEVKF